MTAFQDGDEMVITDDPVSVPVAEPTPQAIQEQKLADAVLPQKRSIWDAVKGIWK